jgi:hypothetical protein
MIPLLVSFLLLLGGCAGDSSSEPVADEDPPVEPAASDPGMADPGGPVRAGGPLEALVNGGSATGPRPRAGSTSTWTFGVTLCSRDRAEDIRIDEVAYEVLPRAGGSGRIPRAETWFRLLPPTRRSPSPIISAAGAPQTLPGEPVRLGDGVDLVDVHSCDGYLSGSRTWPIVEMLTGVTAGNAGGVVTRTIVRYHTDTANYVLQHRWSFGFCGPSAPARVCDDVP